MAETNFNPQQTVLDAADAYDIPPERLLALIKTESSGNPNAVSPTGVRGYTMLTERTAREMGVTDRNDPKQNIYGGAGYLKKLYDQHGDWDLAHAAYIGGPQAIKDGQILPIPENVDYVQKINRNLEGITRSPANQEMLSKYYGSPWRTMKNVGKEAIANQDAPPPNPMQSAAEAGMQGMLDTPGQMLKEGFAKDLNSPGKIAKRVVEMNPLVAAAEKYSPQLEQAAPAVKNMLGLQPENDIPDNPADPSVTAMNLLRHLSSGAVDLGVSMPSQIAQGVGSFPELAKYAVNQPGTTIPEFGKQVASQVLHPFDIRNYSPEQIYKDPMGAAMNAGMLFGGGKAAYDLGMPDVPSAAEAAKLADANLGKFAEINKEEAAARAAQSSAASSELAQRIDAAREHLPEANNISPFELNPQGQEVQPADQANPLAVGSRQGKALVLRQSSNAMEMPAVQEGTKLLAAPKEEALRGMIGDQQGHGLEGVVDFGEPTYNERTQSIPITAPAEAPGPVPFEETAQKAPKEDLSQVPMAELMKRMAKGQSRGAVTLGDLPTKHPSEIASDEAGQEFMRRVTDYADKKGLEIGDALKGLGVPPAFYDQASKDQKTLPTQKVGDIFSADWQRAPTAPEKVFGKGTEALAQYDKNYGDPLWEGKSLAGQGFDKEAKVLKNEVISYPKGSKESYATMEYGTGQKTQADLVKQFGSKKAAEIIQTDSRMRQWYDKILNMVNESRRANGRDEVAKLPNYYREGGRDRSFSELVGNAMYGDTTPGGIPDRLPGPKYKEMSIEKSKTNPTQTDATTGALNYLSQAMHIMHLEEPAANMRSLSRQMKNATPEYAHYLDNMADNLQGSMSKEEFNMSPRKKSFYNVVKWAGGRVAQNLVTLGVNSPLNHFIGNTANALLAKFPTELLKGLKDSYFNSMSKVGEDSPENMSSFLTQRNRASKVSSLFDGPLKKGWEKAKNSLYAFSDAITVRPAWHAFLNEGVKKGMDLRSAVKYADTEALRTFGGYGPGEMPTAFKTPIGQSFLKFQHNMHNSFLVLKDSFKSLGTKKAAEMATKILISQASVYYLGKAANKAPGVHTHIPSLGNVVAPLLDPSRDVGQKLQGAAAGVARYVPGANVAAQLMPNQTKTLLGKDNPFFGDPSYLTAPLPTGHQMKAFMDNPGLGTGADMMSNPLFMLGLPAGGGTAKKVYKSLRGQ